MATPYTQNAEFELGGIKFWSYSAQDAHGSQCHVYKVDGRQVPYERYWATIAHTVNKMDPTGQIKQALNHASCCLHPLPVYMARELAPSQNRTLPPNPAPEPAKQG